MKHYGDITKINGAAVEAVDVICGGSPCQDLSVAGKRAGLAGARSGLFMDQIRIIKEMRKNELELYRGRTNDAVRCRFMVWENVTGAFTSNSGEDFRAVLEETCRVVDENACVPPIDNGRWPHAGVIVGTVDGSDYSVAWRLHDAQFWGVPQRRRRIALVADFGGTSAAAILFERESMSGNIEQSRQTDERTAANITGSPDGTIKDIVCLEGHGSRDSHKGNGYIESEIMYTLNTVERHAVAFRKTGHPMKANQKQGWEQTEINDTLNAFDNGETRTPTLVIDNHQTDNRFKICENNIVPTLSARMGTGGNNGPVIMQKKEPFLLENTQNHGTIRTDGVVTTLVARMGTGGNNVPCIAEQNEVSVLRRLTPKECERLQGYPDDWTNIGDWIDSKGKLHKGDSDSPRYKALGNSIALPFWQWLAERIAKHLPQGATMASLFDGIGGFPLVFSRAGVRPVWASEIEEFPIAVTKKHFPEGGTEQCR